MLEQLPEAVGHALRKVRAGLEKTAFQQIDLRHGMASIDLKSLAFIDHAPLPTPQPLVHAIVVDLPASDGSIAEGALASPGHEGIGLQTGRNSFLQSRWLPPDPPPGHGPHRYAFQLFALAGATAFSETPGRDEVLKALHDSAIASACLIGTFERSDGSISQSASDSALSGTPSAGVAGGGLAAPI